MTSRQKPLPWKLEEFLADGIALVIGGALIGSVVYLCKPLPKLHTNLPSENIAVTNNISTNYYDFSLRDADRVVYERLEIKPYEK